MIKPKNKKVLYLVLLSLLSFFFAFSGFLEITKNQITYPKTLKMGYPPYFITTLGVFKICGAIILLLPNFKKLKEWAFAGFTFDVIFAFVSGLAINSFEDLIKSSFAFFIIIGTYFLFSENNRLVKM